MSSNSCDFNRAWIGKCKEPFVLNSTRCEDHEGLICCSCGETATHECDETGQFVCGAPLCSDC